MIPVSDEHQYEPPKREVQGMGDVPKWTNSEAYQEYRGFLLAVNAAVKGKSKSSSYPESASIIVILQLLDEMDEWINIFPPIDQPQRFGNQAFRSYYNHLKQVGCLPSVKFSTVLSFIQESNELLKKHLPEQFIPAIPEISVYLVEGFGNSTRIDYGTGHEMAFLWFLSCLFKIGFFPRDDKCAIALKVFDR